MDTVASATSIPNLFFDYYLPKANGEFVKIYLYLRRWMGVTDHAFSLPCIADALNMTEGDVIRALRYWEQAQLLKLSYTEGGIICGIQLFECIPSPAMPSHREEPAIPESIADRERYAQGQSAEGQHVQAQFVRAGSAQGPTVRTVSAQGQAGQAAAAQGQDAQAVAAQDQSGQTAVAQDPAVQGQAVMVKEPVIPAYSAAEISAYIQTEEGDQLQFVVSQYLGRPLNKCDLERIYYFHEELHFSAELIDYLFDYCVSNGHSSLRYIERVALSWADHQVTTVEEAKKDAEIYNKLNYEVMRAYGLGNRQAAPAEMKFIKRWRVEWGFSVDMILAAIERTIAQIHQPEFNYTDKILSNWRSLGVNTLEKAEAADKVYDEEQASKKQACRPFGRGGKNGEKSSGGRPGASGGNGSVRPAGNRFHNFEQRSYNFSELEKRILSKRVGSGNAEGAAAAPTDTGSAN